MSYAPLDPVLARQLARAGVSDPSSIPSSDAWAKVLRSVAEHYRHLNDDRALLNRSMELSSKEMEELRARLELSRDQLREAMQVMGEALSLFGEIASVGGSSTKDTVAIAYHEFATRVAQVFEEGAMQHEETAEVSGIRANLLKLADQVANLVAQIAERAQLRQELEVARVVQRLLVPSDELIERPAMTIAGLSRPAAECGGDWWGVYDLVQGRVLVVVGDVTGHGIASAILTGVAKGACDLCWQLTRGELTAERLLEMLNSTIYETARKQMMMTCVAAVFDCEARTLSVASAGHPFALLLRQEEVLPLRVTGEPLGASPVAKYESLTLPLQWGDRVCFYTDGIGESENQEGEPLTDKGFRASLSSLDGYSADELRGHVEAILNDFQTHPDDVTFVAVALR